MVFRPHEIGKRNDGKLGKNLLMGKQKNQNLSINLYIICNQILCIYIYYARSSC